jgi:glycine hydroxymethyltransferase
MTFRVELLLPGALFHPRTGAPPCIAHSLLDAVLLFGAPGAGCAGAGWACAGAAMHLRKPLMHVIAAKAVCFKEALLPEFKEYQQNIVKNAKVLAQGLVENGLRLVSGGTDNHLILVDVRPKGLTGKDAEAILESINITVNKNGIPFDPEKPTITSGIRIGTPALTSRGFKAEDMQQVAKAIAIAMDNPHDESKLNEARAIVKGLCDKYPLYA